MKGVSWGSLFENYNENLYDVSLLENEISDLMMDDDVSNKKGIYTYILSRNEKHLNIRSFTPAMRRESYEKQKGICPICKKKFEYTYSGWRYICWVGSSQERIWSRSNFYSSRTFN